ncbi:MAG: hypothetical protein HYY22_02430 [Thaumarchaeota archaeon]|nr:hypothetical protein [Nitrososphaerota archaeon]
MTGSVGSQSAVPRKSGSCDMSKMVQYAKSIVAQAVAKEKAGEFGLAAQYYLKAADILLIMANNTDNYKDYTAYFEYASNYHRKINQMLQQVHKAKASIPGS